MKVIATHPKSIDMPVIVIVLIARIYWIGLRGYILITPIVFWKIFPNWIFKKTCEWLSCMSEMT